MKLVGSWQNDDQGYRGVSLAVAGGTAQFELLEPLGDDSFLHQFLEERGQPVRHKPPHQLLVTVADDAVQYEGVALRQDRRRHLGRSLRCQ